MTPREILTLPIGDIGDLPADSYVGLIDDTAVECLKARLSAEGLHTPIWVRKNGNAAKQRYSVIAGRHRLRAACALGWTEIAAEVRAQADSQPDELRRLQLVENLDRRVMRPIERACHIMVRWRAVMATLELETVSKTGARETISHGAASSKLGTMPKTNAWDIVSHAPARETMSHARNVDQIVGDACGRVDGRTIRRYRRIYDNIVVPFPDLFAQINAHPLGESFSAVRKLSAIKRPALRRYAIDMLLSRPDWANISEVLVKAGITESTGFRVDPENLRAVMHNTWGKMTPDVRVAYLDDLPSLICKDDAIHLITTLVRAFKL